MGAGPARGLSVSIANNLSDYFYTSMASRGALVKLFLPTDFPDMPSGSLKNVIVSERSNLYVNILGKKLNTSEAFRALPIKQVSLSNSTFVLLFSNSTFTLLGSGKWRILSSIVKKCEVTNWNCSRIAPLLALCT